MKKVKSKKPTITDVWQLDSKDTANAPIWVRNLLDRGTTLIMFRDAWFVRTYKCPVCAYDGDYIYKDSAGRIDLCEKTRFEERYEVIGG